MSTTITTTSTGQWADKTVKAPCLVCGEITPHDRREYQTIGGEWRVVYKGREHVKRRPAGEPSPAWRNRSHKTCPSGIRG